jgi:hypothetical protein
MPSPRHEFRYTKEFIGNLRGTSEPVPVRVNTKLRLVTHGEARDIRRSSRPGVPQYTIGHGGELPMQPSLQAMGRHYFVW